MFKYWCHMQQKKINKGNTSVMDINQIMANLFDKENHVNRNVLKNLAFPSRKKYNHESWKSVFTQTKIYQILTRTAD